MAEIGKTIHELDPFLNVVEPDALYLEVHATGEAASKKITLAALLAAGTEGLPPETAKVIQTLMLGMPAWFYEPELDEDSLELVVVDKSVTVKLKMGGPWTNAWLVWGDGSSYGLPLDYYNPMPDAVDGHPVFRSLPQTHEFLEYGEYTITLTVDNHFGTVGLTRQLVLTPPA